MSLGISPIVLGESSFMQLSEYDEKCYGTIPEYVAPQKGEDIKKIPISITADSMNSDVKSNINYHGDVEIIQEDNGLHNVDTYKEIFNSAYNDLYKSAQTNKQDVIRKVVFYNNKQSGGHIGCFVLFYDKNNQDKPISLFTGHSNDLKCIMWDCVKDGEHNFWKLNSQKFLNIQKDHTSCGIVACEMAKHLTVDWYKKYMTKMKCLKQADIDILNRYKQQQGCKDALSCGYPFQRACDIYKINNITDIGQSHKHARTIFVTQTTLNAIFLKGIVRNMARFLYLFTQFIY